MIERIVSTEDDDAWALLDAFEQRFLPVFAMLRDADSLEEAVGICRAALKASGALSPVERMLCRFVLDEIGTGEDAGLVAFDVECDAVAEMLASSDLGIAVRLRALGDNDGSKAREICLAALSSDIAGLVEKRLARFVLRQMGEDEPGL